MKKVTFRDIAETIGTLILFGYFFLIPIIGALLHAMH